MAVQASLAGVAELAVVELLLAEQAQVPVAIYGAGLAALHAFHLTELAHLWPV